MPTAKLGVWFPVLGVAFVIAGADKLWPGRSYRHLPEQLGWPVGAMRAVAAGEVAGGALLATGLNPRLGGTILAASSAAMLAGELRQGEGRLAMPRLAMLLAALTAFFPRAARSV